VTWPCPLEDDGELEGALGELTDEDPDDAEEPTEDDPDEPEGADEWLWPE
jgi:hypothetical protein